MIRDPQRQVRDGAEKLPASLNIAFLTRGLMRGGAERQLVLLACGLANRGHQVSILVFYGSGYGGGPFLAELASAGVRVIDLKKSSRWDLFAFGLKLIRNLRAVRPDILHSYIAMPNVIAAAPVS